MIFSIFDIRLFLDGFIKALHSSQACTKMDSSSVVPVVVTSIIPYISQALNAHSFLFELFVTRMRFTKVSPYIRIKKIYSSFAI